MVQDQPAKTQIIALKAQEGPYVSISSREGATVIGGSDQVGDSEKLALLTLDSGKTAIRTTQGNTYLSAVSGGSAVTVAKYPGNSEAWTRIDNADGSVSFKSHQGTYLSAQLQAGALRLSQAAALGPFEKFNLADPNNVINYPHQLLRGQPVGLKAFDGFFVSARNEAGATVIGGSSQLGATEVLTLLHFDNRKVLIRTAQGKFLRVGPGDGARVEAVSSVDDSAAFDLFVNPDNTVTLRSAHGTFVRAETVDGAVQVDAQSLAGQSGLFTLVDASKQE